jgi:hypothetical protein
MSLKNPVTPPGIDPGTARLVAQSLNYYATPGPTLFLYFIKKMTSNVRINVTSRRVHVTIFTVEKQQVYQHAKCVPRIILTSVVCLAVPDFFMLSHKRHDFRGKKLQLITCVDIGGCRIIKTNI